MHNQQSGQWVNVSSYFNSSRRRDFWKSLEIQQSGWLGQAFGGMAATMAAPPASCQQQWYVLVRAPDFNRFWYEKAIRTLPPPNFLHRMKFTQKAQGCLSQPEATLALVKHEGGGRGRQKRGDGQQEWGREKEKEERMSTAEVSLQCKILLVREKKKIVPESSRRIKN